MAWQMSIDAIEWQDVDEARVDTVFAQSFPNRDDARDAETVKAALLAHPGRRVHTPWHTEYRYQSEAMQQADAAYEAEKAIRDTAPVVEPYEDWREQLGL